MGLSFSVAKPATRKKHRLAVAQSYSKARERIATHPPDPTRARNADPGQEAAVVNLVNVLAHVVLNLPSALQPEFLPGQRSAIPSRRVFFAVMEHARNLSALLELERPHQLSVAASSRDVALLAGCSTAAVRAQLRAHVQVGQVLRAGHWSHNEQDAITYELHLPERFLGLLDSKVGQGRRSQSSRETMAGVLGEVAPPIMAIARHDAFATAASTAGDGARGLGGSAGFVLALIAGNSPLTVSEIARACGTTPEATRQLLRNLNSVEHPRLARQGIPLIEPDGDRWRLEVGSVDALLDELNHLALAMGTAGRTAKRIAAVQLEREEFRLERTGRQTGPRPNRLGPWLATHPAMTDAGWDDDSQAAC